MRRESHVRFCEGLRGRFPRATRPAASDLGRWATEKYLSDDLHNSSNADHCFYCTECKYA